MADVILVDKKDREIGLKDKIEAHLGDGHLHRAFTVLVFNKKGETLIAKRSANKMLWPLFWDNTCASHPKQNESYVQAAEKRLSEELGFTCKLQVVDRFFYKEKYKDIGSENEICTTLVGEYNGAVFAIPSEVADYKWISIRDLKKDILNNPDKYTVWFKIALNRLLESGNIKLEESI